MSSNLIEDIRRYPWAFGLALVLHLAIAAVAVINFESKPAAVPVSSKPQVNIVQAEAIDAQDFDQAVRKHRQVEERKRQQAQEEKKRKAEAQKRKVEEQKRLKAEKKREAEEQKRIALEKKKQEQKKAEEARKKEKERKKAEAARKQAEERRKAEARAEQERVAAVLAAEEAELREQARIAEERRIAAERSRQEQELARYNQQLAIMRAGWIETIAAHVGSRWIRPPGTTSANEAEVFITQAPGGFILDVRVGRCSGSTAFCQSVEAAVRKSEPLPQPEDKALFERDIKFTFRPLGL
jgi:colicin import membrane protein